jgi:hypothetical protein
MDDATRADFRDVHVPAMVGWIDRGRKRHNPETTRHGTDWYTNSTWEQGQPIRNGNEVLADLDDIRRQQRLLCNRKQTMIFNGDALNAHGNDIACLNALDMDWPCPGIPGHRTIRLPSVPRRRNIPVTRIHGFNQERFALSHAQTGCRRTLQEFSVVPEEVRPGETLHEAPLALCNDSVQSRQQRLHRRSA